MSYRGKSRTAKSGICSRPIIIHVCKDGTVAYRRQDEPVINALPVFSVDTPEQAERILVRFCRRQYGQHPELPGRVWYRLSRLSDGTDLSSRPGGALELEDLDGVTAMFRAFFDTHLSSTAPRSSEEARDSAFDVPCGYIGDLRQYIHDRILFDLRPNTYGGRRTARAIAGNHGDPRRPTGHTLSVADVQPVLDEMVSAGTIIKERGAYMLPPPPRRPQGAS